MRVAHRIATTPLDTELNLNSNQFKHTDHMECDWNLFYCRM